MDGRAELLIGSSTGTEFVLWKLQLPNGALKRIAGHDLLLDCQALAASPDGRSIVLITVKGDLIMMDGDGSHAHRFLSPPEEMSGPDGQDVHMVSRRKEAEIYLEPSILGGGLGRIQTPSHSAQLASWNLGVLRSMDV